MERAFKSVRVIDIILDSSHELFSNNDDIGKIYYKQIEETLTNLPVLKVMGLNKAKPLFSFIKNYPLKNEIVLIIESQGNNSAIDTLDYYLPTLNIWNHPHHGAFPFNMSQNKGSISVEHFKNTENGLIKNPKYNGDPELRLGKYFQESENIRPLLPYEGDIILEGRFGNSIRFGSTTNNQVNPNRWSVEGEIGSPITIIRNGQIGDEQNPSIEPIIEDIDGDDSSIYLTSDQQLTNFTPASLNFKSWGANLEKIKKTKPTIITPILDNQIEPEVEEQPLPEEEEPVTTEPTPITEETIQEEEEINEKTFEDSSNITEFNTDTNKITPSSTIILNKGTLNFKIINEDKDPEFKDFQEIDLNQPIGANFTLKHLISSKHASSPEFGVHEEAELERVGIFFHSTGESPTGVVQGYYIKDILGFYLKTAGPTKRIIIKDSDMGIIYEGETSFSTPLQNLLEQAESAIFSAGSMYYDYNMPNPGINNYPGIDSDLIPGGEIVSNLKKVMENCIDKIFSQFSSLEILSAYRGAEVDNCVDASAGLDHIKGYAIDFKVPGTNTSEIFNWCFENLEEWKDLMWAYPERESESWIHISYVEGENEKHTTLASEIDSIHEYYESNRRGSSEQYQDGILEANQELI